ncbi:MAG TPA: hypothetical protein VEC19_15555 [Usitatibacter sp.]|nr:hypothetical protein [Usitatibacter sp.]
MRKRLSATKLHELLEEEFRKTAGDHCLRCRVPMPAYFAGAREGPNWRAGSLAECDALCHTILQDIAERLARRYDLAPSRRRS